ncbi:hypothetical protein [Phreatobacter stygius]|uniref:UrcA family protein n=1 Tax=Phreatobacter stygius TaxID=1940610 RepID=A0A4D7BCY6_9HYPH|nr:hypothetical protein [Phreatobacter stygius]QCI65842.1 hypothetical protein E8M01_17465 [Phreatobacter stygius]
MTRMSKTLVLSAFAAIAVAAALVIPPASRAAVSPAPGLTHAFSSADIDHAHRAFDGFKNQLDGAPRPAATQGQAAMIQGDRADAASRGVCAQYTWPHIPRTCQTAANGRELRQIRTVTVDTVAATR